MMVCSICDTALHQTPSGLLCPTHGGAPPMEERRDDPAQLERVAGEEHLVRLRLHIESGGTLDNTNARWMLERAEGGIWGRMAARATGDAREHRKHLRAICDALINGSSNNWGAKEWAPIRALLEERPSDLRHTKVPDWPFRMVEMGEGRE